VEIAAPTCVRATKTTDTGGSTTGIGGIGGNSSTAGSGLASLPDQYNSVWDISTTVIDGKTGTSTAVRQGVRALLSKEQFETLCSS